LTNGGCGIGVLAVDRLADLGGTLAKLNAALPPIWSRANPIDIAGDADAKRYALAGADAVYADISPKTMAVARIEAVETSTQRGSVKTEGWAARAIYTEPTSRFLDSVERFCSDR
jgi:acetyltransferase